MLQFLEPILHVAAPAVEGVDHGGAGAQIGDHEPQIFLRGLVRVPNDFRLHDECFDAIGSTKKTFKLFTRDEGGYHHCQSDNVSIIGTWPTWDWLEDVLEPLRTS